MDCTVNHRQVAIAVATSPALLGSGRVELAHDKILVTG